MQSGCSDTDPVSSGGDPGGHGRNCQNRPRTGCSDRDPADPGGAGRNCQSGAVTGCSDRDPTDQGGRGRSCTGASGVQPIGRYERRYDVCWVDDPNRPDAECNLMTYSEWQIAYSDGSYRYDTSERDAQAASMQARGYSPRWHRMAVNDWRGQ